MKLLSLLAKPTLLAKASIEYQPGDSILLKKGDTWNEELAPKGSGTPEKPILISSYGEGKKPLIDREDFKQDRSGIFLKDQGGFKITGLEFAHCMTGIYAEYSKGSPTHKYLWIEDCHFRDSLLYQRYEDYPKRKIGLGVCLFEEGYQWQLGIRGVDKGSVKNCVTHDIGRGFKSFNGVAGAMFFRCKDWIFEDSEWGYVDIGLGSGDGQAFDFEGNSDNMTMRNCNFHDSDGPGFLLCCYASDSHPNRGIVMENCVINGKSKRPLQPKVKAAILNTTDWTEATWKNCRFYLAIGEVIMAVMDPEKEKRSTFTNSFVKDLSAACS